MSKVYYVGDWAVQIGPVYAETSFNHAAKGLDMINYGKWLVKGVESSGRHEIVSVPTWDFYNMPPGEFEKVLEEYDIIVFSDVEAKNFQLHPQFFNRHLFGTKVLTFPDRVRLTVEAVKSGTHCMFLGGWLSFNGEMGKGGWGRTQLREVLPCRPGQTQIGRKSAWPNGRGGMDLLAAFASRTRAVRPVLRKAALPGHPWHARIIQVT